MKLHDFLTKALELITGGRYTRVTVLSGKMVLLHEKMASDLELLTYGFGCDVVHCNQPKYRLVDVQDGTGLRTMTLGLYNTKLKISTDDKGRYIVKLPGEPWQTVTTEANARLLENIMYTAENRLMAKINLKERETGDLARDTEWEKCCSELYMTPGGNVIVPQTYEGRNKMKDLSDGNSKVRFAEEYKKAGKYDYAETVRRTTEEKLIVNGISLSMNVRKAYASAILSGGKETEGQRGIVTKIDEAGGKELLKWLKYEFICHRTALRLYKTLTAEATVKSFIIGTGQNQTDRVYSQLTTSMLYDRNKEPFTTAPQLLEDTQRHTQRPLYIHGSDNRKTIIDIEVKNGVITKAITEHTRISGCSTYDPLISNVIEDGEKIQMGLARATVTTKVTSTDALEGSLEDTKVTQKGWATALSAKELAEDW
ncbi:hypothetical protein ABKZ63_005465 [Salmonella enterica]